MSPSWRESLRFEVGAAEVRLRRYSRGWKPRVLRDATAALGAATPDALGSAVATLLAERPRRPAGAHVLLSGDWTRLALLDGARALRSAERGTAAAHALRRVYGDGVEGWQVCHGRVGGSLLAAAVDPGVTRQLTRALDGAEAALASLRPSFVAAFNACLRWLERPTWLVVVEPGRAVVCFCDGSQLRSLRSHRLHRELGLELPAWLQQQRLIDGFAEPDAGVVIAYRGTVLIDTTQSGLAITLVDLDAVGDTATAAS